VIGRSFTPTFSLAERQRAERIERLSQADSVDIPALLEALADPSWSVRRFVIAALIRLGDAAVAPLCDLLRFQRDNEARIAAAVDVLSASTGSSVDAAVLELAESPDPAIAADAAQVLGRRRSSGAIPTLAKLTLHFDDNVAVAAIEALGRVGGRAAVDSLIGAISSGNFFRTFPAIDVLGRSGDPRAVPPLAGLLDDPRYAHEAARALGRTGDKSAVVPLTGLLARPSDALVRLAAAALCDLYERYAERFGVTGALDQALREVSPSSAVRRLIQATATASPVEQAAICRVLGSLGMESAAPLLTNLLDAPAPIASAAAEALKKLGRDADAQLLEALQEGDSARRRVLLPLITGRSSASTELVHCLHDLDPVVRCMACDTLARIGDPSVVPSLFPLLSDPNPRIVQSAIGAIQSLGSAETEALTLAAARSPDAQVRRAAFRIIAYFGYGSALDLLIKAIHGTDERLRDSALYGLPFIDDPRALEALLAAASHEDPRTRAAAMRALGQCQAEQRVTEVLQAGLADTDPWVRYYACQSLGKLAFEPAAEAIAALLEDKAGQVRVSAVEALSHMKGDVAFTALSQAAASKEPDMQLAAIVGLGLGRHQTALPVVLAAAGSPDPATRLVAVSALASFNAPEVDLALGQAAADSDEGVRTAAIGFLASHPTPKATQALIELLDAAEPDERILAALSVPSEGRIRGIVAALSTADDELSPRLTSALARMRQPEAITALLEALSLSSIPARKAAAATLGAIGNALAVEALKHAAVSDPDPEVRRICALALAQ
jgi:HEAT repeat protein